MVVCMKECIYTLAALQPSPLHNKVLDNECCIDLWLGGFVQLLQCWVILMLLPVKLDLLKQNDGIKFTEIASRRTKMATIARWASSGKGKSNHFTHQNVFFTSHIKGFLKEVVGLEKKKSCMKEVLFWVEAAWNQTNRLQWCHLITVGCVWGRHLSMYKANLLASNEENNCFSRTCII